MVDLGSLESLVAEVDAIISVCPPMAALDVAAQVSRLGFDGLYVDVNAVSPVTVREMGRLFVRLVDGGVVGPPPASPRAMVSQPARDDGEPAVADSGGTRLYLSGQEAPAAAAWFARPGVDSRVIGSEPGQASALKMAYAAWTKGTSALLLAVGALATSEGVMDELLNEWDLSIPGLSEQLEDVSGRIGTKAWRFVGEMEEIARSHGEAGLPTGFHLAAADVFSRLADLKDRPTGQPPADMLDILLDRRR
jgi:hypothetical protein